MSSCSWCGVPLSPPPLRCGVLVYLHVPKCGGSTVTRFLQQHASGGTHGWWQSSVTPETPWDSILHRLHHLRRPRQIVIHHVDAPTSLANRTFFASVIEPLKCHLRSLGCRLVLTSVLRNASTRATSAAFYNRVPRQLYSPWIAEHARDSMVSYVLHNRVRLRRHNRTIPMKTSDLLQAQSFLERFDAIGRTEELGRFLSYLTTLLHGRKEESADREHRSTTINRTPEQNKYQLTAIEKEWTRRHTRLDEQLFNSFCAWEGSTCRQSTFPAPRTQKCNLSHS